MKNTSGSDQDRLDSKHAIIFEIGRVAVEFSIVDRLLVLIIWKFVNMGPAQGQLFTNELNFNKRINLFKQLTENSDLTQEDKELFKENVQPLNNLSAERNRLMHSTLTFNKKGDLVRLDGKKHEPTESEVGEVRTLADDLKTLTFSLQTCFRILLVGK